MIKSLCGSGHRPDKLGGYGAEVMDKLQAFAVSKLRPLTPERVVSGMALGWDQALAAAAIELGIPFVAAVPFPEQERMWPVSSQRRYLSLLGKAAETVHVTMRLPSAMDQQEISAAMQKRNIWMAEHSDYALVLWNGSPGGTANFMTHARKIGLRGLNVWGSWRSF